jgi:hypothetical protein
MEIEPNGNIIQIGKGETMYMAIALFDGIDGAKYFQSFGRKGFL